MEILSMLPMIPSAGISAGVVMTLVFIAFLRGWIHTGSSVSRERERHVAEIATVKELHAVNLQQLSEQVVQIRADHKAELQGYKEDYAKRSAEYQSQISDWKEAYNGMDLALATMRSQTSELLELARTSEHVLRSLPEISSEEGKS